MQGRPRTFDIPQVDMAQMTMEAMHQGNGLSTSKYESDGHKVDRTIWKETYELIGFSIPDVVDTPSIKKKFKIQVEVFDSQTNISFAKTVYFGEDTDYMWTQDKNARLKMLATMTGKDNPLHANYWRTQLCLYSEDFCKNVSRMVQYLLDKRLAKLNCLKPKKDFRDVVEKRRMSLQKK